ncbi:hypothetical protein V2J09_003390 [Rumex salicifolius]
MDSRMALSDSNDFSNGSSTCCLGPYPHHSSSVDNVVSQEAFAPPDLAALRRLSDNLDSISESDEFELYADANMALVSGQEIAVHRCILAARSPYLKSAFASFNERDTGAKDGRVRIELKKLAGDVDVGFDALSTVLAYLYSGKVKPLPRDVCVCVDDECSHEGCRPAVDFMVEVLYLSFTFQIAEFVSLYQRRLLEILDKTTPDDLLIVLYVASLCESACQRLHTRCVDLVVKSDVDNIALEKSSPPLPMHIVKLILEKRKELGLIPLENNSFPDKHAKRIYRALDSDDIELVNLLLKEGHTSLDDAYALHYAVAYSDAKTTSELLGLERANVNCKNLRGFSVLHVAAMRRDPKILLLLLTKGAWSNDITPDGRNALQISKRLTKVADWQKSPETGIHSNKDRLCIEILEQAEERETILGESSPLAKAGDDLHSRLLYLEGRVALARLYFPREAKVAMDIAKVDGTTELPSKETEEHLIKAPFVIKEEHHQRIRALEGTVRLGKRYFPRCSNVIDQIMDTDNLAELVSIGSNTPEERMMKKQRLMEIQEQLSKAFTEDLEANRRTTGSSSSSAPMAKLGRLPYKRSRSSREGRPSILTQSTRLDSTCACRPRGSEV